MHTTPHRQARGWGLTSGTGLRNKNMGRRTSASAPQHTRTSARMRFFSSLVLVSWSGRAEAWAPSTVLAPAPHSKLPSRKCRAAEPGWRFCYPPCTIPPEVIFPPGARCLQPPPDRASSRTGAEAAAPWCGEVLQRRPTLRRHSSRLCCFSCRTLPYLAGKLQP